MKRILAVILAVSVMLGLAGAGIYLLCQPTELLGSADVYHTITLQIQDNLFYDVHVPVEAKLESTDGATIYSYDLLTVGVQDTEPTTFCKVKVADRWVFAASKEGWLKAAHDGFETEQPYEGAYDTTATQWIDNIPEVVIDLDQTLMEKLRKGGVHTFGGMEFVNAQISYGTFEVTVERALRKMATLYHQPITYGMLSKNRLWVTSNLYTVAVAPINYNTCLVISAYGETGKQIAAAFMREGME